MENKTHVIPTIAMRGIVAFPHTQLNFDVARKMSVEAIGAAKQEESLIFLVSQTNAEIDNPTSEDIHKVGTIAKIKQVMHLPGNVTRIIVTGVARGVVREFATMTPYIKCVVDEVGECEFNANETEAAYVKAIKRELDEYYAINPKIPAERFISMMTYTELAKLCDSVAAFLEFDVAVKQKLLSEFDLLARAAELSYELERLIEVTRIEKKIVSKTRQRIDEGQQEYFLREQMQVIQDELGDKDGTTSDVDKYRKRINSLKTSKDTKEKLLKDVDRLAKLPPMTADSAVVRSYLDTVLDLPWNKKKREKLDLAYASGILEEDHYGLEKVKERIIEFLAVRCLTKGKNAAVICLVGPPGVGKTSIAKSVARALDRKYVRVSLGGIHDESDIRGHRKTYIGAMEGRIMAGMRDAKVKNPLMLLDEIDKMGHDYKGDPSAALLEVLDNEQNSEFRDHYIEVPFDLSDVMFITTANSLDTISQPLLDRMEIIELSGYTAKEKFCIARNYLVKKALDKTGMAESQFEISDGAIERIINNYTREAGVRKLEQTLEKLIRRSAKEIIETNCQCVTVDENNIEEFLGKEKYRVDLMNEKDEVGVVRGLAWTYVGGDTLSVEANVMDGTGKVELTGKLGDVMKESAMAAISFIRANAEKLGVERDFYKTKDIHIHVPEGAVPKDGPSAGITMATAVISSLTERAVKRDIAMTGEITLRGNVLPIGGLKEKSMAAYRAGIKTVIMPKDNICDIDDVPSDIREDMEFIPVSHMNEVIEIAFRKGKI